VNLQTNGSQWNGGSVFSPTALPTFRGADAHRTQLLYHLGSEDTGGPPSAGLGHGLLGMTPLP
jgi:hypothetical protein